MNVYDVHVYFVTAFRQSVSRKNKNVKEKQLLQRSLKSCLELKVKKNLDAKANKCNRSFLSFSGKFNFENKILIQNLYFVLLFCYILENITGKKLYLTNSVYLLKGTMLQYFILKNLLSWKFVSICITFYFSHRKRCLSSLSIISWSSHVYMEMQEIILNLSHLLKKMSSARSFALSK